MNDIIELKWQGLSVSQISAMSGYDRKTIRKYLGNPKIPMYKPRISNGIHSHQSVICFEKNEPAVIVRKS